MRLDADLALHCRARSLPEPVREFRFHRTRKWRFDWAFPSLMLAVEQEGIVYPKRGEGGHLRGRHVSVKGFKADIEKYLYAFAEGWTVLRCLPSDITSGRAADAIEQRLKFTGAVSRESSR